MPCAPTSGSRRLQSNVRTYITPCGPRSPRPAPGPPARPPVPPPGPTVAHTAPHHPTVCAFVRVCARLCTSHDPTYM
jgi:hypothetical protein